MASSAPIPIRSQSQTQFPQSYEIHDYKNYDVQLIPSHSDNYCYLIMNKRQSHVTLVDVSDVPAVLKGLEWRINLLKASGIPEPKIEMILSTHKHWDHADGNEEFLKRFPNLTIVGNPADKIPAANKWVKDGDKFSFNDNMTVEVFEVGCHTIGHILFLVNCPNSESVLFTGDTLFNSGCGRFFEGDSKQMHRNLNEVIGKMEDELKFYCGHEYTLANLEFSGWLEPTNSAIKDKVELAKQQRALNLATVPGTIGGEKATNPFMRVMDKAACAAILARLKAYLPEKSFGSEQIDAVHAIREAKNANAHKSA